MTSLTSEILFEKFQIIEVLKKDEYAAVFLANHIYLSKKIILKVLNTQKIPDPSIVERFKREAKILARLDHPNIIKVLDFGTSKEYFYISFEYIEGESLRNAFKTKSLTQDQKEHLMVQLLRGLGYAHANNIIHRDIKPENVFIDKNLNAKLGDFGLALSAEDNFVTNPYSVVGTPSYMSPEQVRGAKLTPQSDLFSAGVVLFELFSGKNPFLKDNVNMTLNEIISMNETSLETILTDIPEKFRNVLLKLLKKNVNQRYQSVEEIFKDLNIQPDQATVILNNVYNDGGRTKLVLMVFAVVVLIIAGIVFVPRYEKNPKNLLPDNSQSTLNHKNKIEPSKPVTTEKDLRKDKVDLTNSRKPLVINEMAQHQNQNTASQPPAKSIGYGALIIDSQPWAKISINGQDFGPTPITNPIRLPEGEYTIKLVAQNYPPQFETVLIKADKPTKLNFSFDSKMGFIRCAVYPWGNLYVNGEFKSEVQAPKLIRVLPDPDWVHLIIQNPGFKDIDTTFKVLKGDTTNLKFYFIR